MGLICDLSEKLSYGPDFQEERSMNFGLREIDLISH